MRDTYTPTTHDVREAWLNAEYEERDVTTSDDDLRAEFDRWLAAHDAQVRAALQELADHGLRFDLNPTMQITTAEDVYAQWAAYARRMDESVRTQAREALAAASPVCPEWEYGYELVDADTGDVLTRGFPFNSAAEAAARGKERAAEETEIGAMRVVARAARRRPADPWEPLPED